LRGCGSEADSPTGAGPPGRRNWVSHFLHLTFFPAPTLSGTFSFVPHFGHGTSTDMTTPGRCFAASESAMRFRLSAPARRYNHPTRDRRDTRALAGRRRAAIIAAPTPRRPVMTRAPLAVAFALLTTPTVAQEPKAPAPN